MNRLFCLIPVLIFCLFGFGCASIKAQQQYGKLQTYTYTRDNLTLETSPKTAYIAVEAPQGITGLKEAIENRLQGKGMTMVDSPGAADLVFAVALSDAGKTSVNSTDLQKAGEVNIKLYTPEAMLGRGISNLFVNNWVSLDTLKINAHVTMIEKMPKGSKQPYIHKETILSIRAQKTNLNWEDCATEVNQQLSQEITKML